MDSSRHSFKTPSNMAQEDIKQVECLESWKQEPGCSGSDGTGVVRIRYYNPGKITKVGGTLRESYIIPAGKNVKFGVYQNTDWSCCSGWTRIKVLFEGEFPKPDDDESLEVYSFTYDQIIDAIEKANTPRGARLPC